MPAMRVVLTACTLESSLARSYRLSRLFSPRRMIHLSVVRLNRNVITQSPHQGSFKRTNVLGERDACLKKMSSLPALKLSSSTKLTKFSATEGDLLLVAGANETASPAKLKLFFEKYFGEVAEITDYQDMRDESKNSRIYYVLFSNPTTLRVVLDKFASSKNKFCYHVKRSRVIADQVPVTVSKDMLARYLREFGVLFNIIPILGKHMGNSWVIDFEEPESAAKATERLIHTIDGWHFHLHRDPRNKDSTRVQMKFMNLSPHTTVEDIREVSEKYGTVVGVELDPEYSTAGLGLSAWVVFDTDKNALKKGILKDQLVVSGKNVDVVDASMEEFQMREKETRLLINGLPENFAQSDMKTFCNLHLGHFWYAMQLGDGTAVAFFKNTRKTRHLSKSGTYMFNGNEVVVRKMEWKPSGGCSMRTKKVILGNLPPTMTVEQLGKQLEQFGKLESVNMILFKKGVRSPRAFVEYSEMYDGEDMHMVLKSSLGEIEVNMLPDDTIISDRSNKLVIEHVPENLCRETLFVYLSKYGRVRGLESQREGDALVYYVSFHDPKVVQKVKQVKKHVINNKVITFNYLHWSPPANPEQQ